MRGIAFAGVALEHQAQVQPADLDRGVAIDVGVAVADLDLGHGVARPHRAGRLLGVGLDDAGPLQHQGEHDTLVARVGGHVDRRRRGVVAGDREGRAVGQHALRRVDAQLAERERGIVDGHRQ